MIDHKHLRELSILNPARFSVDMILNWMIVLSCMFVWLKTQSWMLYPVLIFIVATRQQAMGILVHDIAHNRYLKNTALADLIGNILMGYPLLLTVETYRIHHLKHHRHINTEQDPDWNYKIGRKEFYTPITKTRLALHLLKTTLGYGVIEMALYMGKVVHQESAPKKKDGIPFLRMGYYLCLGMALIFTGLWKIYLLMWLVPQLTFLMGLLELRSFTEHVGLGEEALPARTIKASGLERFLFNPHYASFHLEHHLYPSVPYYNLAKLHTVLMRSDEYAENTTIAQGYFKGEGVIAQLVNAGPDSRLMK